MTPIRKGTAERLGLRKPHPFAACRRRWALGLADNPASRAMREASRVDWPQPSRPMPEVLDVVGFQP